MTVRNALLWQYWHWPWLGMAMAAAASNCLSARGTSSSSISRPRERGCDTNFSSGTTCIDGGKKISSPSKNGNGIGIPAISLC